MGVLVRNRSLDKPRRSLGDGSLQPLMLALQIIGHELHTFIERGGRILTPEGDGSGFAGALITMRALMRKPGEPMPPDPVLAELDAGLARYRVDDDEERRRALRTGG